MDYSVAMVLDDIQIAKNVFKHINGPSSLGELPLPGSHVPVGIKTGPNSLLSKFIEAHAAIERYKYVSSRSPRFAMLSINEFAENTLSKSTAIVYQPPPLLLLLVMVRQFNSTTASALETRWPRVAR